MVSTDHCAFRFSDQKTLGVNDFSKIPNGGPGIENRLSLLYTHGVASGFMDLNRLVELFSTNPARLFGLFPRKGTIAVGSDADIVIFDPDAETVISAGTHHMNVDYNLYEGMRVKGVPEVVIVNGRVLVEDGEYSGIPAGGRFPQARHAVGGYGSVEGDADMKRVGLIFLDRPSLGEQVALVRYAEERGFDSAWACETRLARDAMTPLAAFAQATSRIRLATGVVNNWTRTTGLMAMTLATLHELSGGRVSLGIGAYWDPLAQNQGIRRRRHLAAMREYVTVVRGLLNMETVNLDGEVVKVQDLRLDLGDGIPREPINVPIYIGATGPQDAGAGR